MWTMYIKIAYFLFGKKERCFGVPLSLMLGCGEHVYIGIRTHALVIYLTKDHHEAIVNTNVHTC